MMKRLYASPLRVYLLLFVLAAAGIFAGFHLPVSLFPNSSKPFITVNMPYSGSSAPNWYRNYGMTLESKLQGIVANKLQIDHFRATYGKNSAHYEIEFAWGNNSEAALNEVNNVVTSFAAVLPDESRNNYRIENNGGGSNGFMVLSFYSDKRSLDDVYDLINPILGPKVSLVPDVGRADIFNPNQKEVRIELNPKAMAAFQIFPKDVERAISESLSGRSGGSIALDTRRLRITISETTKTLQDLAHLQLNAKSGLPIHLSDVARIDFATTTQSIIFKTSGTPSIILFALPRDGGNVKRMGDGVLETVQAEIKNLPSDIHYKVLINPADFINEAIRNVFQEVFVGALLAVAVLFLFMGNLKNVITTAIEIPMSMVLAFILMHFANMNLNLISLGGLALASGMNVDASVVVMENIFRHREMKPGPLSFQERLDLIIKAVKEVRFAVISSTIASLVVFIPLTFTSDISYAILGDLAKAVVFSHAFSAVVALILVPTVRLQLSGFEKNKEQNKPAPLEGFLKKSEDIYTKFLHGFIQKNRVRYSVFIAFIFVLILLFLTVLPKLPKEIIGLPDTDWLILNVSTTGNTISHQLEPLMSEIDHTLQTQFEDKISYTFTQITNANNANVMIHLKNKKDMNDLWKKVESFYPATPLIQYSVVPWNPSELQIPNPPDMRLVVQGGDLKGRVEVFKQLHDLVLQAQVFPNIWSNPLVSDVKNAKLSINQDQWASLRSSGLAVSDLSDILRTATEGKQLSSSLQINDRLVPIYLRYPSNTIQSLDDVESMPIGVTNKIVPLKALAPVSLSADDPDLYREDGREILILFGKENMKDKDKSDVDLTHAKNLVQNWTSKNLDRFPGVSVAFENASYELDDAIRQLSFAVCLSVILIFLTLVLQFGTLTEPLLVLIAVPSGLIGVLVSLWIFHSSLSLNSVLGVILLNGIAVNNSIILVDFIKKIHENGVSPIESILQGSRARLRPILITSLATVLGMLPIALGLGSGGKILQPLGIAVSGGLWISMLLTLFLVPALYVSYLKMSSRGSTDMSSRGSTAGSSKKNFTSIVIFGLFFWGAIYPLKTFAADSANFYSALEELVNRDLDLKRQHNTQEFTAATNLPDRYVFSPTLNAESHVFRAGPPGSTDAGASGTAGFNIFHFGENLARYHAAAAENAAQGYLLKGAEWKAESQATKLLFVVLQARQTLNVKIATQKLDAEALDVAQKQYESGRRSLQEFKKLKIETENASAALSDARLAEKSATAALVAQLGHDVNLTDWPWENKFSHRQKNILSLQPDDLLRRPDYLAAVKNVEGATQRYRAASKNFYPSLDAYFNYGFDYLTDNAVTSSTANSIIVPGTQETWTAKISLSIPIWDQGVIFSRSQTALLNKKKAEIEKENIERTAQTQYDSLQTLFESSLESTANRIQTFSEAEQLLNASKRRFQNGIMSVNDLILDNRQLYDTKLLLIQGWFDVHSNFVDLCHAKNLGLADCIALLR